VLTATQKTDWVQWQLHQAALGNRDTIACPYCGLTVVLGVEGLCCGAMNDIASELLERMESSGSDAKNAAESSETGGTGSAAHRNKDNPIQ
jgi:hypothetical protein